MTEIIGYILSVGIGISLGLIGSGGSILGVPILVYFFAVSPEIATTHSLFIVGITSAIASYKHHKQGNLRIKPALYFGLPSLITLLLTRKYILPGIPSTLIQTNNFTLDKQTFILVFFAMLMIFASISMIKKQRAKPFQEASVSILIVMGILVGLVIGILGAGGGFLIVPALVLFGKLDMKYAIATSLFVITSNSLLGFVGDLINKVQINYYILVTVSSSAIIGMFIGMYLSKKIDGKKLKPGFGWFILIMGIFIITKEIFFKN